MAGGVWLTVDQQSLERLVDEYKGNSSVVKLESEPASGNGANSTSIGDLFGEIYDLEYFNYLVIVVGAVTLLISCFGFCGAKKESVCLLGTCISFTMLLLLLQIAAIVIINPRHDAIETLKKSVDETLSINLSDLEGDGWYQTVFFGLLAIGSLLTILVSCCFCRSVRKQNTEEYKGV